MLKGWGWWSRGLWFWQKWKSDLWLWISFCSESLRLTCLCPLTAWIQNSLASCVLHTEATLAQYWKSSFRKRLYKSTQNNVYFHSVSSWMLVIGQAVPWLPIHQGRLSYKSMITAKQFNGTSPCASIMEKKHSATLLWEDRGKSLHFTLQRRNSPKQQLSKLYSLKATFLLPGPRTGLELGWLLYCILSY